MKPERFLSTVFNRLSVLTLVGLVGVLSTSHSVTLGIDFNPEVPVSTATGSEPGVVLDAADNVLVPFIGNGDLRLNSGPAFGGDGFPVVSGPSAPSTPAIFNAANGVSTIVYVQDDQVYAVSNPGGPFGTPMPLGATPGRDPQVAGFPGVRYVAWVEDDAVAGAQIYVSENLGPPVMVAEGENPCLATDENGNAHLAYVRGGDVYYRAAVGAAFQAELTVSADPAAESEVGLGIDPMGVPHLTFTRGSDIWLTRADGMGGFTPAVNVSFSSVASTDARLLVVGPSTVQVVYLQEGEIWTAAGVGSFILTSEQVSFTPGEDEDQIAVASDSLGFTHLVYRRSGQVYYRNAVVPPGSDFTADPLLGEAPLEVTFSEAGAGLITQWEWDFGDGETSTDPNPVHTFQVPGTYTVSLTVTGLGGSDTMTYTDLVEVAPPENFLRIPSITVYQGETDVRVPILATHPEPIQGFQIALTWDNDAFEVHELDLASTDVEILFPEFIGTGMSQVSGDHFLTLGVLIDSQVPFDGRMLAPGIDQRITNIVLDVRPTADTTVPAVLDLQNGVGNPPITNVFTIDAISVEPLLTDGALTVLPAASPPPSFLRGDLDSDGSVALPDVVLILNYLFASGPDPQCFDAADGNDDGALDIADPIFLLNWKFGQGPTIPYPFPTQGLDPSPDNFPACP